MKFKTILGRKVKVKLVLMSGKARLYKKGTSKRFINKIQRYDWIKCYIKVCYGKNIDVFGKKKEFYNDGEYEDKKEAIQALRAFLEV
jgi:hypothetical protein